MASYKFNVPIYDWDVLYIRLEKGYDLPVYLKALRSFGLTKDDTQEMEECLANGGCDGARCFLNSNRKKTAIVIFPSLSIDSLIRSIGHECRHCVDDILEHTDVKDNEASAYLSGYISKHLFKGFKP